MSIPKPRSFGTFSNSIERVRSLISEGYSVNGTYEILRREGLFTHSLSTFRKCYYKAKNNGDLNVEAHVPVPTSAEQSATVTTAPLQSSTPKLNLSDFNPNDSDYQDKLAEAAFRSAD